MEIKEHIHRPSEKSIDPPLQGFKNGEKQFMEKGSDPLLETDSVQKIKKRASEKSTTIPLTRTGTGESLESSRGKIHKIKKDTASNGTPKGSIVSGKSDSVKTNKSNLTEKN